MRGCLTKLALLGVGVCILYVAVRWYVATHPLVFNESVMQHAYCILSGFGDLSVYAQEHGGAYPYSTNGYADAILSMTNATWYGPFSGPGYEPDVYAKVQRPVTDMKEELVGRVYVQGLRETSNSQLPILFDKRSSAGGDHCHLPRKLWAPIGRDVVLLSGETKFVPDTEWAGFCQEKLRLLISEGFSPSEARKMLALDELSALGKQ